MRDGTGRRRVRIRCTGAVQGVGFRPYVYRLAAAYQLDGWVLNDPDGVLIEVEGPVTEVAAFLDELPASLPPLARLDSLQHREVPCRPAERGFRVETSGTGIRRRALVPPDAALCRECRTEMATPGDRRFHYPFTGCASCGPRFSLVRTLPYDRERTTMACFPMCSECRQEYSDPADRRFHTEPICCPACGPRLWYQSGDDETRIEGEAALDAAVAELAGGGIVAIKGLGGYQLACRADDETAVARLRARKRRPSKPFALMGVGLETVEGVVELDEAARSLLLGPRSPIVLAPARRRRGVAPGVAPGVGDLGLMLPTTPLHVELFRRGAPPLLVMTSGNASDEPICTGNREALRRLRGIADGFLMHDRDIARRVDDSVVRTSPVGPILLRRARGWVPEPILLPRPVPEPVLALGAHLQVTACLVSGTQAVPSQHVGDLETEAARGFLREVALGLEEFLQVTAPVIAADLHPDYGSTLLAEELAASRGGRLVRVQHHLAHMVSVLAEHGLVPGEGADAVGVILDGTGWGPDGTAWGGEWIVLESDRRWRRAAHLGYFPLVGGEAAVREPWRVAAAVLELAGEGELLARLPLAETVDPGRLQTVRRLARSGDWPLACGAGRLFEAGGALLGLTPVNGWEGEAAARLEALAASHPPVDPWPELDAADPAAFPAALLTAAAGRLLGGQPAAAVARGFHESCAALAAGVALGLRPSPDTPVVLGGGCFVNRLLLASTVRRLEEGGARVLWPRRLPPGDGGLALGQAVWAAGRPPS